MSAWLETPICTTEEALRFASQVGVGRNLSGVFGLLRGLGVRPLRGDDGGRAGWAMTWNYGKADVRAGTFEYGVHAFVPAGQRGGRALELVLDAHRRFLEHELREGVLFGGERVFDPHAWREPEPEPVAEMRGLTLWQPYASLIALEHKEWETRPRGTAYRGRLAIHAAKRWDVKARARVEAFEDAFWLELPDPMPLGVVVAVADLVDVVVMDQALIDEQSVQELAVGDWQVGRRAWRLQNVRPLAEPYPLAGSQATPFRLKAGDVAAIEERLAR